MSLAVQNSPRIIQNKAFWKPPESMNRVCKVAFVSLAAVTATYSVTLGLHYYKTATLLSLGIALGIALGTQTLYSSKRDATITKIVNSVEKALDKQDYARFFDGLENLYLIGEEEALDKLPCKKNFLKEVHICFEKTGRNPLHKAITENRMSLLKALLYLGGGASVYDVLSPVLNFALSRPCHEDIIKLLIAHGADINYKLGSIDAQTPVSLLLSQRLHGREQALKNISFLDPYRKRVEDIDFNAIRKTLVSDANYCKSNSIIDALFRDKDFCKSFAKAFTNSQSACNFILDQSPDIVVDWVPFFPKKLSFYDNLCYQCDSTRVATAAAIFERLIDIEHVDVNSIRIENFFPEWVITNDLNDNESLLRKWMNSDYCSSSKQAAQDYFSYAKPNRLTLFLEHPKFKKFIEENYAFVFNLVLETNNPRLLETFMLRFPNEEMFKDLPLELYKRDKHYHILRKALQLKNFWFSKPCLENFWTNFQVNNIHTHPHPTNHEVRARYGILLAMDKNFPKESMEGMSDQIKEMRNLKDELDAKKIDKDEYTKRLLALPDKRIILASFDHIYACTPIGRAKISLEASPMVIGPSEDFPTPDRFEKYLGGKIAQMLVVFASLLNNIHIRHRYSSWSLLQRIPVEDAVFNISDELKKDCNRLEDYQNALREYAALYDIHNVDPWIVTESGNVDLDPFWIVMLLIESDHLKFQAD